jgi:phosphocarrier protein
MPSRTVTVASRTGLHARPAAVFVKKAGEIPLPVTLAKNGGTPVSARSLLAVMTLDVRRGDEVLLQAEAADGAEEALELLARLLESELGE